MHKLPILVEPIVWDQNPITIRKPNVNLKKMHPKNILYNKIKISKYKRKKNVDEVNST